MFHRAFMKVFKRENAKDTLWDTEMCVLLGH